ncbi:hypothetical protein R77591_03546 [Ralstonia mannitolilytica]|uniref:Uncharacterized protein n=2 Tax=Ralstonia mannitolilytica TaxID=105219 RepID=A0AAD2AZA8_9RALS|nr:hypothetical protein R77591_03546 [Ralstonia mannitolilytica]CAJ0882635.1 hypothetical protein R77569_03371 [Ralstonia mannitolilytica]
MHDFCEGEYLDLVPTMRIDIDFSIFDSPVSAYGKATGDIEVKTLPNVGDVVDLFEGRKAFELEGFSGRLKVTSVDKVETSGKAIFALEDVVVSSRWVAAELAARLETELGLFCIDYDQ